MYRKFILVSTILFGLAVSSCDKPNKKNEKSHREATIDTIAIKDTVVIEQIANTPSQICEKKEVPILCYHRITEGKKGDYTVTPATFESHMKILADSGYHSISPEQLYDYLVFNKSLPEKPVIISFDDSRIEHFQIAAPVMEKNGFRGVFFIMTITYNKKNYMTKEEIAQLSNSGHTIGLHSWDHTMVKKYKDSTDWQKQVVEPKAKLEKKIGII